MDKKRNINNKRGMTLIEIIVVVVIVAILAAVAIPSFGFVIKRANIAVDNRSVKLLNDATDRSVILQQTSKDVLFEGLDTDQEKMQFLVENAYLSEIPEPKQENTIFAWDTEEEKWQILTSEASSSAFKSAFLRSELKYSEFISTSSNFGFNATKYTPDSWNGYIEKLLESGNLDSNKRVTSNEGSNQIDYTNPISNKKAIINYHNFNTIISNYSEDIPPAILITRQNDFAYDSQSTYIKDNLESLKGTMVFYKKNNIPNEETQVYFINEDGSLSDLIPIDEILPK